MSTNLEELAAEAFIYGFPLVFNISQVQRSVRQGIGSMAPAPFNTFAHADSLASPADTFVSVNNDTVYSIGQVNATAGPVTFTVPATGDRYFVMQFVDPWTNNFAYVGTRATGGRGGTYLLTPPGWAGELPAGSTRIALPATVASIIGRWACAGPEDLPAVAALQQQLVLTPTAPNPGSPIPAPADAVPEALSFFEQLRTLIAAFHPAAADIAYQQRFASLGLLDDQSPYLNPPSELMAALTAGVAAGRAQLEQASKAGLREPSGWMVNLHMFDYNLDNFELGTIDEPEWKIPDRTGSYLIRAVSDRVGLWGNHAYEAVYPQVFVDSHGRQLNGAYRYQIRFQQPPPAQAFWSLTMYDTPDYFLVENPIGRYSIGDRTPGLRIDPDGSITIHIQHQQPEGDALANWLPAPAGDFRPMLRIYIPGPTVLDGSYQLPPITRVDE